MFVQILFLSVSLLWTVDGEIFELYSTEGEIARNAEPGSLLSFDAPLRISKEMTVPFSISLPEPAMERMFRVSPGVVKPGGTFTIALRNAISAEISNVDLINITLRATSLQESADGVRPLDQIQTLQVYLIGNTTPKDIPESGKLIPSVIKHTITIPVPFRCVGGQILYNFTKEAESFDATPQLSGEFSELFQLEAVSNENFGRTIRLTFRDGCPGGDHFAKELAKGPLPLILRTNGTVYLIQFLPSAGQTLRPGFHSAGPIEAEIAERARHFTPRFRLRVYDIDGSEVNLARNFTFKSSSDDPLVTDTFYVHPSVGVVLIRDPDILTIEKLSANAHFNVTLYENDDLVDSAAIVVRLRPSDGLHNANGESADASTFRFMQPVYAFAVGPGATDVGRVRLTGDPPATLSYAISEGGASYFHINPLTGMITYYGGLERSAKNYTIKAIAYDSETELLESASVQVLVAGIGSLPPQLPKKFEIVEVPADVTTPLIIHTVRGVDFDQDARLQYRIVNVSCLNILGQPLDCVNIVYFGSNGIRNGSLIFQRAPLSNDTFVTEFLNRKTDALANMFVNVSVTDINHALEPSDYASIAIRVTRASLSAKSNSSSCQYRFDTTQMAHTIQLDDSLPPNSYVYSVAVCTPSLIDEDRKEDGATVSDDRTVKVIYSLQSSDSDNSGRLFEIHSETGVIRNVASLKEAPRRIRLNITAKDENARGDILDTISLVIECQSFVKFAPEFSEKFYAFEVSREAFDTLNTTIGTVVTTYRNADPLQYTIVELEPLEISLFQIDAQGRVFRNPKANPSLKKEHNFFVRATGAETSKFAVVPVRVRISGSIDSLLPHFGLDSPQKVTLMENAAVGTFVVALSATNAKRFEIHAADALPTAARLAGMLSVTPTPEGAVIRTFSSLRGYAGTGYALKVVAYGSVRVGNDIRESNASIDLSVDVISVAKCLPTFAVDQPLVFDVTNVKPGDTITQLRVDIESGCEIAILLAPESTQYGVNIDPTTGRLTVTPAGIRNSYGEDSGRGTTHMPLVVIAKSGHAMTQISIELRIIKPMTAIPSSFSEHQSRYRILETLAVGDVFGRLSTNQCPNASFAFVDESDNEYFSINSTNGEVGAKRPFIKDDELYLCAVAETGEPWSFHLRATATCAMQNGGSTTVQQPADIFIDVVEINNHTPEFDQAAYEFSVDKNELIGTTIGRVTAFDKDITELHYSIDKTSYYRRGTEKRLRDIYFELDARSGEIVLHNSLADLNDGFFELNVRVRDTPPLLLSIETNQTATGRSATTAVQIWITSPSEYVTFIVEDNPIHINSNKIDEYLKTMTAATPSFLRPARAFLHDARYHFVEEGREILRNATVLRVLFVNIQKGEIIAPRKVDEFIRDLTLPGLRPFDNSRPKIQNTNPQATTTDINDEAESASSAIAQQPTQMTSVLILTAIVFAALLVILLTMLAVIMCYYRQRFLRERQFLRDARIANQAMVKPSTIRQFALVNTTMDGMMTQHTAHLYPPNPYVTEPWDDASSETDNFYYATQEMKISMR